MDKITGSKAERKGLNEALAYARPGDTFMVWKLDRAGRSLKHLIELLKDLQGRSIEFVSILQGKNGSPRKEVSLLAWTTSAVI